MKQFIQKMLLDESDSPSTKRVIALIGSVILFLTTFINSFSEVGYAPSAELIAGCVTIICVCLGASTVDKFSPKNEN